MASRMERSNPQLVAPASHFEMLAHRTVVALLANDGSDHLFERDKSTVELKELATRLLGESSDRMDID